MTTIMKRVLIVAMLAVVLYVDSVLSCMCMPEHPQTDYCNADFVFKAKIRSRTNIYDEVNPTRVISIRYEVLPKPVFRNAGTQLSVEQSTMQNITTSGYEASCGVTNMTVGQSYLITAREIDGKMYMSLCSWNSQYSRVPSSQRKMLKGDFERVCAQEPRCQTRMYCGAPVASMCPQFDGCTFRAGECRVRHSYCTRENGSCRWEHYNRAYQVCLAAAGSE